MRLGLSRRIAVVAIGAIAAGGLVSVPVGSAQAAIACRVTYSVMGQWPGGFQGGLTITNTGDAWNGWSLTFTFPSGQTITQGWVGKFSQSGSRVTVTNEAWNGNVGSGQSASPGFIGSWNGSNAAPTDFAVNGVACGDTTPTTTTTTTTRPTTTTTTTTRPTTTTTTSGGGTSSYTEEFLELYNKIHASDSGYFSPEGVPYHSIETLMVEAPDHGHETTSEAFSYYLWLEAEYGQITGDWAPFNTAWATMEKYIIPSRSDYRFGGYNTSDGSDYAPDGDYPSDYPTTRDTGVSIGSDPLWSELSSAYGSGSLYQMHWLLDVDNVYGYGKCGDGTTKPAFINTYQRGVQESVWETVAHPSCETFKWGAGASGGFLPIFMKESSYAQQWRFTSAPDADARAIQAAYWALTWAKEQGKQSSISSAITSAAKMGDYLRYAMYDKHFKMPGCTSTSCTPGSGKAASNYLINWYVSWGGAMDGSWAFLIGSSGYHQGYQNPLAAYVLSSVTELIPKSSSAKQDWATTRTRSLDFLTWLQSAEGAFAGGANNSWNGRYENPPSNIPDFYGLHYDWQPVWNDPPSNRWFGFQAWGTERLAEYYYLTKDERAGALLDKWVDWALAHTTITADDVQFPSDLAWSGTPGGNWSSGTTSVNNAGLHVTVQNYTNDIGVAGAYARLLAYYAAATGDAEAKAASKGLLDYILTKKDDKGVSLPETRKDYNRFTYNRSANGEDGLYIPSGYSGVMANGDPINSNSTFLSIRTFYKDDPDWPKVQTYLDGGAAPTFNYHRFWAQVDVATALADYGRLFPEG